MSWFHMVIDPLVSDSLMTAEDWAEIVSKRPTNIYFITSNTKYQQEKISLSPEWKMTTSDHKKVIEGLTGYSSGSLLHRIRTKKYLKKRYKSVKDEFYILYNSSLNDIRCLDYSPEF